MSTPSSCLADCYEKATQKQGCKKAAECLCSSSNGLQSSKLAADLQQCLKDGNCGASPQHYNDYLEGLCGPSTSRTIARTASSTSSISSAAGPLSSAPIIEATSQVDSTNPPNTAAIAGGVVGTIIILAILLGITLFCCRRRRRNRLQLQSPEVPEKVLHIRQAASQSHAAYSRLPGPPPLPKPGAPMTEAQSAELWHANTIASWQHKRKQSASSEGSVYSGVAAAMSVYSGTTGSVYSYSSRSVAREGRNRAYAYEERNGESTRPLMPRGQTWETIPVTPVLRTDPSFRSFSIDGSEDEESSSGSRAEAHRDHHRHTRRHGSASSSSTRIEPYTYRPRPAPSQRQFSDGVLTDIKHTAPQRTTSPQPITSPQSTTHRRQESSGSKTAPSPRPSRKPEPVTAPPRNRRHHRFVESIATPMTPPPLYNPGPTSGEVSVRGGVRERERERKDLLL